MRHDLKKWLNTKFKNSKKTHYKLFEDDEPVDDSPFTMERKPKVYLSEDEKREISRFLNKKR